MRDYLWKEKRFLPLLVTQFFGAFNDNLFKNTLMTFVAYRMLADTQTVSLYSNAAAGIFILPYFLFSAFAGLLADKFNRAHLTRILKITELLLMVAAGMVFMTQNAFLLLMILFFMGLQSTFFGPIKYALLPQLLRSEELIAGNAYVEASTYVSIILGSVCGTILPVYASIALLIFCSLVGMTASFYIPNTPGVQPKLPLNFNFLQQIGRNIRFIRSHVIVYRTIIGATWFWILGTFFLTELFPLCSKVFHTEQTVVTLFLILFSLGVATGSFFCNRLLKGEVSIIYVPISAIGLSVCSFVIYLLSVGFKAGEQMLSVGDFMLMPRGAAIAVTLFLFAFMGGMYIVPLNALMQKKAPKNFVATVIAGNNIINSLGMVAISLSAALLSAFGFRITDLFLYVALISAGVAFYICKLLPVALLRSVFCFVLNLFFHVEVQGIQNLRQAGSKVLLIANHVSLLDGILLAAYLPRKITFAIDSDWAQKWYVRLFDGIVDFYPLNPTNPLSVRSLIGELDKGKTVMIFPEGRISVTGSLMKVYEGAGVVAVKSGAKVVAVRIEGAECSKFSYIGDLVKTRVCPKIKLHVMPAHQLAVDDNLSARERRYVLSLKIRDMMADMIYKTSDKNSTLFNRLLDAAKMFGSEHKIALDTMKKTLSYGQLLMKIYVLGAVFTKMFARSEKIGILLPNSLAGVVSFFALQSGGKIPVMMNFSLGTKPFASSIETVKLTTILTARKFIEQGHLEHLEQEAEKAGVQIVYLEDVAGHIRLIDKIKGLKNYWLKRRLMTDAQAPAVILFTSGSEGLPKAVVLSHENILANVLQIQLNVPFNSKDIILNALPMFHSFGLTVGTILPLLHGVKTFFYPSPLHYRIIPEAAYDLQATAILGTDTFLYGYGRMAHAYDFFSVRFAVVGGEKLKQRTADLWMKKFGVRIFEGYGTTETSPVISVNTPMFYKENTVGRFLPNIQYQLQKVAGVAQGGKLLIKSDTVMLGYIFHSQPDVLQKSDEWYDTGDIVTIDQEGFIEIKGRAKRFAKIGGEMVSLNAIEQLLDTLYPDISKGLIIAQDEAKGEKIVLVTADETVKLAEVKKYLKTQGMSELNCPRELFYVQALPLLGNGKFDYMTAQREYEKQSKLSV
ncbi:MAG: MFS transporter [Alphaproteobacteria bacterium]|nr:MFS transporter [Alphaproteobacteria bacterium]